MDFIGCTHYDLVKITDTSSLGWYKNSELIWHERLGMNLGLSRKIDSLLMNLLRQSVKHLESLLTNSLLPLF
jgi:hypothetical protein